MYIKFTPENLNPNYYLPHLTNTYTCEITIIPKMYNGTGTDPGTRLRGPEPPRASKIFPKKKNRGLGPPEIFAPAPLPLAHHSTNSE